MYIWTYYTDNDIYNPLENIFHESIRIYLSGLYFFVFIIQKLNLQLY